MKIIFNHVINDWYWQIYDELLKNHQIILPKNYESKDCNNTHVDMDILEKTIKDNSDIDFIFDFRGNLFDLIQWNKRKVKIPLIIFATNIVRRPYGAKMSVFAKIWYVEGFATPLVRKYEVDNLIYEGMASNPNIFYPLNIKKEYDVGFFGQHYGERGYWIEELKIFSSNNDLNAFFPMGHGVKHRWSYSDINQFYNQTKINLSFAPKGIIVNLRTFEICMSGNFQLMQYTPYVEEYFEIDEEIVCWKNKKDLFEKIIYYKENNDEREKIAKKGYDRAIKDHTWSKRFEKIGATIKSTNIIDLDKYIIKLDKILNKDYSYKMIGINEANSNIEILKYILKILGFKIKRDLKRKTSIKIRMKEKSFIYKPNLKNYFFIDILGKTMMVMKVIALHSKIGLNDWKDLKKILYLTENADFSLPQFGLITTGLEWLIYDFKNRRWLKQIPNRKLLKTRV